MPKRARISPSAPAVLKKTESITFNLSPLLFRVIEKHCRENNLFIAQFVRQAIEEKLRVTTPQTKPEPKGFWARLFG